MKNTTTFTNLLESCTDYEGFSIKPSSQKQATQSLNAFIKEFLESQSELFYDDFFMDYYNLTNKYKSLAEQWSRDRTSPFTSVLKKVFELETGQVQHVSLSSFGREGLLDDTKPTKYEAARLALKNNEKAMQIDNKAFYEQISKDKSQSA